MINFLQKLNKVFKTNNNFQLFIVFLVFGLSGSISVMVSSPIIKLFALDKYLQNTVLELIIRILIIFPIYQVILICVGTVFGQFRYFWNFQKHFFKKFKKKV